MESHGAEFSQALIQLVIILIAAKIGSELAERIGQPAALGELLFGVGLGLTLIRPENTSEIVRFLAEVGVIILLFEVGLESDLDDFLRVGPASALVAIIGVVAPFGLGYVAATALGYSIQDAVFVAATLTATSIGISARVLTDLRQMATAEARIILGAAVIDDILGLLILSVVLAMATTGRVNLTDAAATITFAVIFLLVAIIIGIKAAPYLIRLARAMRSRGALVVAAFSFCLILAIEAERLGMATIIGAFAAGLVLASTDDRVNIQASIKPIADIFVPVFFVLVGAQVRLESLNVLDPASRTVVLIALVLVVVAVIGKLLSGLGAIGRPVRWLAIGVGMIPRGEVGLIFASVGLTQGIIGNTLYTAIVFVVLVTTFITPPWLKRAMSAPRPQTPVRRRRRLKDGGEPGETSH